MNNIGDQINLVINNISDKLGVAANQLYPCLRTQAMIDGIVAIIWLVIGVVLFISMLMTLRNIVRVQKSENGYDFWTDNKSAIDIALYIVFALIISIPMIYFSLNTAITALANPDWYIIHSIISQIKG